jgi:hypothetical protein
MVSLKQRDFYILPALPLFALAWALLFEAQLKLFVKNIPAKIRNILFIASVLFIVVGIGSISWHAGTYSRDKQLLTDIKQLLPHISAHTTISMDKSMFEEWNLYPYFARYKNISLDVDNERELLLVRDSSMLENYQNSYSLKCRTKTLLLYEKIDCFKFD